MPVTSFTSGDLFIFEVTKALSSNPDLKFRNTYEMQAVDDGTTSDIVDAGLQIVAFEKAILLDVVDFVELRVATWEPDSVPYDPTAFLALPLSGTGDRPSTGSDILALNICLNVARVPVSGRFGHLFYRGFLREIDVRAPAGDFILDDPSGVDSTFSSALSSSGMDDLLAASNFFGMVMVNADGSNVRRVFSLSPQGVSTVPTKHKWFNRTPTP